MSGLKTNLKDFGKAPLTKNRKILSGVRLQNIPVSFSSKGFRPGWLVKKLKKNIVNYINQMYEQLHQSIIRQTRW